MSETPKVCKQVTRDIMRAFTRRCIAARSAGGISAEQIMDGKETIPTGWHLDSVTDYYIPPNVELL